MTTPKKSSCVSPLAFLALGFTFWMAPFASLRGDDSFFESQIRPLFVEKCIRCHGPEKQSGGVRLDSHQALKTGGKKGPGLNFKDPTNSRILKVVRKDNDVKAMPPDEDLSPKEIQAMETWIKMGAVWPSQTVTLPGKKHWAFELPSKKFPLSSGNPVDYWVDKKLASKGIKPLETASRHVLLRRMAFDLIGLSPTMEEQERTANLQAASVSETTTTMDELGASSRQSEEQAESASQAAQEVLQLADNGNQSVEETVSTMVDLKNKVAAIADQIVRLSEQTNQIGNISSVVSDLSQQTNMLALNASVEAVRAGEHGKGFAVVAEEIRKLADQSRQSASNIGSLVSDIQNAINTTVMVTDEGTKTVNAGLLVTERTANAFSGVLESVNNVAMNNQQIVLNIRQQGKAVQQVLQAMDSINQGAQQTAASLSQVKAGTATLAHTARDPK
jgi:mono/diheme cytochrome c family protein